MTNGEFNLQVQHDAKQVGQVLSAKGAKYESQGQVRSEAEHVAPGKAVRNNRALKVRNRFRETATLCRSFRAWET